jgi:hypothetical protein
MTQTISNAEILDYFAPERCMADVQAAHDELSYGAAERMAGIMSADRRELIKTAVELAIWDKTADDPNLRLSLLGQAGAMPDTISPVTILFDREKLDYKECQYNVSRRVRNLEYRRLVDRIDRALPEATEAQKGNVMSFLARDEDNKRRPYERRVRYGQNIVTIPEMQRHARGITFTTDKLPVSSLMRLPGIGAQRAALILAFVQHETLTQTS